ncbi:MAG: histidine kinase [Spirochaetaceae bacterium]
MVKHRKYLAQRVFLYFFLIFAFNIITLLILITTSSDLKILILVGNILFLIVTTLFIILPYYKLKTLIKNYTYGYENSEFFKSSYSISPEIENLLTKIDNNLRTEDVIKNSNKHAQYLALQNQINPHFLYNTLEGIRSDALSIGVNNIAKIVESLAVYFRYTISRIDKLVTLDQEMANLKNYLVIQNYRFGDQIKMSEEYDGCDRSIGLTMIPKLILQPFFENAIIHGLEEKIDKGEIKIIFSTTDKLLLITIEDNGVGIPEEKLAKLIKNLDSINMNTEDEKQEEQGGIAIKNVNNRIKLLLGDGYGINIRSAVGVGTAIDIVLPL